MGHSNYKLTDEQKKELDIIAEEMLHEIESKLHAHIRDSLDPYVGRKIDNNKLNAMVRYIADQISNS